MVAGVAVAMCVAGVAAHYTVPPRVVQSPFLLKVDNARGTTEVITVLSDKVLTGDDALDKSHLSRYVLARESYNWHTIQKDYTDVGLMSSPEVAEKYLDLYRGDDAIQEQYRDKTEIEVKIISVVPTSKGIGTVRYETHTTRLRNTTVATYVATIGYEYQATERMTEADRLRNPLGFVVLSYRNDAEIQGAES